MQFCFILIIHSIYFRKRYFQEDIVSIDHSYLGLKLALQALSRQRSVSRCSHIAVTPRLTSTSVKYSCNGPNLRKEVLNLVSLQLTQLMSSQHTHNQSTIVPRVGINILFCVAYAADNNAPYSLLREPNTPEKNETHRKPQYIRNQTL